MGCIIRAARSGEINVILHCANCFHTMGAGVARAIKDEWPGASSLAGLKWPRGDRLRWGHSPFTKRGSWWSLIFMARSSVLQAAEAVSGVPALRRVLRSAAERLNAWKERRSDVRIGYPLLGCGLAGGNWDTVKRIIDDELKGLNHKLYTL